MMARSFSVVKGLGIKFRQCHRFQISPEDRLLRFQSRHVSRILMSRGRILRNMAIDGMAIHEGHGGR